jgi:hypothetical protein
VHPAGGSRTWDVFLATNYTLKMPAGSPVLIAEAHSQKRTNKLLYSLKATHPCQTHHMGMYAPWSDASCACIPLSMYLGPITFLETQRRQTTAHFRLSKVHLVFRQKATHLDTDSPIMILKGRPHHYAGGSANKSIRCEVWTTRPAHKRQEQTSATGDMVFIQPLQGIQAVTESDNCRGTAPLLSQRDVSLSINGSMWM